MHKNLKSGKQIFFQLLRLISFLTAFTNYFAFKGPHSLPINFGAGAAVWWAGYLGSVHEADMAMGGCFVAAALFQLVAGIMRALAFTEPERKQQYL